MTPPKADPAPGAGVAAADGQALYTEHCSGCHGGDYQGGAGIPPVRGAAFMANWKGKTADQLHAYLKTAMPPGAAGTLSDAEYRAIAAHILKVNGAD